MTQSLLVTQFCTTLFMTGLIWFVQVVHYPLMKRVGPDAYVQYEREHVRRTTWVVLPVMSLEVLTALSLFLLVDQAMLVWASVAGCALLGVIWGTTLGVLVPLHKQLSLRFDALLIRRLVKTNWLRTAAWSARALLLFVLLCL